MGITQGEEGAAVQAGRALRERRRALGINMTAAAEAAGMSRVTWHRLETGEGKVRMLAAAAAVLGLRLALEPGGADSPATEPPGGVLPLAIRPMDYPQLERLAWQIDRAMTLTPREAWDLYRRNHRHLEPEAMSPQEQALLHGLQAVFGDTGV